MSRYTLKVNGRDYTAQVKEITAERAVIDVDGTLYNVDLVELGRRAAPPKVQPVSSAAAVPPAAPRPQPKAAQSTGGTIPAPLPGLVLQLRVKEGDSVAAGQLVMIMEAMKMENQITSPHTGTIKKVFVGEGDSVGEGDPLVEISRPEMTTL